MNVKAQLTPEQKEFRNKSFTLEGRLFYPRLLKPEFNRAKTKEQFSAVIAWKIGANSAKLKEIEAHLKAGAAKFFPTIPVKNLQLPIKTWGKYEKKDGSALPEFYTNCQWMNMTSGKDFKPHVALRSDPKTKIESSEEIYSGRNCAVSFKFFEYKNENFGISVNLDAILLFDGGDKVSGGGSVNVEEAFKEFLGDANMVSAGADDSFI